MNTRLKNELTRIFNEVAPIARYFGMKLEYDDEGRAVIELPFNPDLDHALGAVHGGVYATMLDNAGWFTAALARNEPRWLVTSELTIHFLKPAVRTSLRAVGNTIKRGKRQDIVEMHLYDGQNSLVGHAVGTFVILPDAPLERPENTTPAGGERKI